MIKRVFYPLVFILILMVPALTFAWPIPDTGQSKCYDNTQEIPCPQEGQPFYGQDGNYTINPPSYTKLDTSGNDLPDDAASWVMVRDNVTGLIWEVKNNKDGSQDYTNPNDADNIYTWYDSNPATNGGYAGTPGEGTDTEDFINALNATNFGGHSDWRMPNNKDIHSIFDYRYNNPVNPDYFPNTLQNYWSSTSYAYDKNMAWRVSVGGDGVFYNNYKSYSCSVRAVRGGQPLSLYQLIDNGDGTVTDINTGLMWQQTTSFYKTWANAISYCDALSLAGYSDWRMPSIKELHSIADNSKYNPAINTYYFPGTDPSIYWSSTTVIKFNDIPWLVDFYGGHASVVNMTPLRFIYKSDSYSVRAVRGGQNLLSDHLSILEPNQADRWNIGKNKEISWDTKDITGHVKISLSRQGGKDGTFETISESTENDGSYMWAPSGPESVNCMLKIEPKDYPEKGNMQGLFSIIPSLVTGDSFTRDTTPTWSWSTGGGTGDYRYKLDDSDMDAGSTVTMDTQFTPDSPLSEGPHILYVQEQDSIGNWSDLGMFMIIIDLTPPESPVISGNNPTNDTKPTWSWSSGGGGNGTFRYKLDNDNLDEGSTTSTGTTYTSGAELCEGLHTLYVQETDNAGNWSFLGYLTIMVDTSPPSVPISLDLLAEDDTGWNDSDNLTNKSSGLTITGSGENGETVRLFDNDNPIPGAVNTVSAGVFSIDLSLTQGTHNITADQSDVAGNVSSKSAPLTIIIDTTALSPSGLSLSSQDDSGVSSIDQITQNINALTILGAGETGATVRLYEGGNEISGASASVINGNFSIDISFLSGGTYNITAIQTDTAGNVSAASNVLTIIADNSVPSVEITQPENPNSVLELNVIAGIASDAPYLISKAEVQISYVSQNQATWYLNSSKEWILEPAWITTQGKESWSYNTTGIWSVGTDYTIIAKATDLAGNFSSDTVSFTFGVKPSFISCILSKNEIKLGEDLSVSGQIKDGVTGNPIDLDIGVFVYIALLPTTGPEVPLIALTNTKGAFSTSIPCEKLSGVGITSAGQWKIRASWTGDDVYKGAASNDQFLNVQKAKPSLSLDVVMGETIKVTTAPPIGGRFLPSPYCDNTDLSDMPVQLIITYPNETSVSVDVTTNRLGQFLNENFVFNQVGEWKLKARFSGSTDYAAAESNEITIKVVATAGYAIIVQGKIDENGEGLASHQKTTDFVYQSMKDRGLQDEDIVYYNYVTNPPSKNSVKAAVTGWAFNEIKNAPGDLYIVMVNHGWTDAGNDDIGKFYIHPSDPITSIDLNQWLDTLQNDLASFGITDRKIIVILGFCRAGAFIDEVSDNKRVVIASAAENEYSHRGYKDVDAQGQPLRDGEFFVSEFFKKIVIGKSIYHSFSEAKDQTEIYTSSGTGETNAPYYDDSLQHPLLDDNSDTKGSNALSSIDGEDGYVSSTIFIGTSPPAGNDPGDISIEKVSEAQFVEPWLNVVDLVWAETEPVDMIWVEVKRPGYDPGEPGPGHQIEMETFKKATTDYNSALKRYEWKNLGFDSVPSGYFSVPGTYQVFYFAKDITSGKVSPMKVTTVYRKKDANNPPNAFRLISPESGANTSTKVVLAWADAVDPDGDNLTYTVVLSKNDDTFSNPIGKENIIYSTCLVEPADGIEDLSTYYWKVLAIDELGEVRESEVRTFYTNNTVNPGAVIVIGHVYNVLTGNPVSGAEVDFGFTRKVTGDGGYYIDLLPPGAYDITVTTEGYVTKNILDVLLGDLTSITIDIELTPEKPIKLGDINGNDNIDLADAILAMQVLAGSNPSSTVYKNADVNGDGKIGLAEVIYILQEVSG